MNGADVDEGCYWIYIVTVWGGGGGGNCVFVSYPLFCCFLSSPSLTESSFLTENIRNDPCYFSFFFISTKCKINLERVKNSKIYLKELYTS